uniref:DUF1272 domain-containing protein n=1 Tax=Cyanothece sp. (strain PCC 7425 / ATCC 29141) TaxID=395961 RepID=B8HZE4_CYAP4
MIQLCPNCKCCNRDLLTDSPDAKIYSFECTFCVTCAESLLYGHCPNYNGELIVRPRRPASKLFKYPASLERVFKPTVCGNFKLIK